MSTPSLRDPAAQAPVDHVVRVRPVEPDDALHCPLAASVVARYVRDRLGALELRLTYGQREISFDDSELFAFGEVLSRQQGFMARDAMGWSDGLAWARVQGLLDQLIEEGVLEFAPAAPSTR